MLGLSEGEDPGGPERPRRAHIAHLLSAASSEPDGPNEQTKLEHEQAAAYGRYL
jgi:hypothetical protein